MSHSRRTFLKGMSGGALLGMLGHLPATELYAMVHGSRARPVDEALLRELALVAIDVARGAGATFADVRVSSGRYLTVASEFARRIGPEPSMGGPRLDLTSGYGVRVIVNGAWGFAAGARLSTESIRATTLAAMERARANRPRRPRTLELAPAPVVPDGRWSTPIVQDPFTVPVGEQADSQLEALATMMGVNHVLAAAVAFAWQQTDRVFASSEGTVQAQRVALAFPSAAARVTAGERYRDAAENVEGLLRGGYGYEAVSEVDLEEGLRAAAEKALTIAGGLRAPIPAEVGRYDLVCSPRTMAALVTTTLATALNAERVLGYQANDDGTSFAAPPAQVLGALQLGPAELSVRADRTQAHGAGTMGWDDEGVSADDFGLIEQGVLVDYLTNRQTAAEIGASRGAPARSHGCASGAGREWPGVQPPNLTVMPGSGTTTVEDLIADTRRGFYINGAVGRSDQQVLNTQLNTGFPDVWEIRDGKLGERVESLAFQFITPSFWKSIDGIGGAGSERQELHTAGYLPDGIQLPYITVSAVPARFQQVNVLNTGGSS